MASRPFLAAPLATPSPADVVAWRVGNSHWRTPLDPRFFLVGLTAASVSADFPVELRLRNSQRVIIRSKRK